VSAQHHIPTPSEFIRDGPLQGSHPVSDRNVIPESRLLGEDGANRDHLERTLLALDPGAPQLLHKGVSLGFRGLVEMLPDPLQSRTRTGTRVADFATP